MTTKVTIKHEGPSSDWDLILKVNANPEVVIGPGNEHQFFIDATGVATISERPVVKTEIGTQTEEEKALGKA